MSQPKEARTPLSRRSFLRFSAFSGGAALLAACGGATTAPTADGTTAPGATAAPAAAAPPTIAASGGQVTIEWANGWSSAVTQEVLPLIVAEFETANPNIKIQYENPGPTDGYAEGILTRIAGGNPPDIFYMTSTPTEYAARGSLVDISDYMSTAKTAKPDAFFPGPLASCQWQGKTYALPTSAGASAVYTNVQLFKDKGLASDRASLPATWDDAKRISKELTISDGSTITQAGLVPFIGNNWMYPVWMALNGGQLFDVAANKYTVDSENNVQWLDYWVRWLDELYGGNLEALSTAGNWDDAYPDSQFALGKQAMVHTGSWVTTDAQIPFEFEVAKMPVGPGGSKSVTAFYPNWFGIPKGAKHPDEAFLFIEFLATTGWQTWYKFIMDTPAWRGFPPDVLPTKLVEDVGEPKAKDYNTFFAEYLNDSIPMWNSPVESFAQETLNTAVGEVMNKVKSPKAALAEVQAACQARLDEVLKTAA